jgi:hypothetical protein
MKLDVNKEWSKVRLYTFIQKRRTLIERRRLVCLLFFEQSESPH